LYATEGLARLDNVFVDIIKGSNGTLYERLARARSESDTYDRAAESELILDLIPHFEKFVSELFGITEAVHSLALHHKELDPIYFVKRSFVQRRAVKGRTESEAALVDGAAVARELELHFEEPLTELAFARHVSRWLEAEHEHQDKLGIASTYALWA